MSMQTQAHEQEVQLPDGWERRTDGPFVESAVEIERTDGDREPAVFIESWHYQGEAKQVVVEADEYDRLVVAKDRVTVL